MSSKKPVHANRNPSQSIAFSATRTDIHVGPLPRPDFLAKYNEIIPDGANRIMLMAERQQEHRFGLENKAMDSQLKQSSRGQIFGFIICLIGLSVSGYMAYLGYAIAGSILGGTGLIGLVSLFVVGKYKQRKNLEEKKPR